MGITVSTIIYLLVFSLTMYFSFLSQRYFEKKGKVIAIAFAVFAVLLPSVLAGVRGDTVGRDVMMYGVRIFDMARHYSSFFTLFNSVEDGTMGLFFLAFILSRVFSDAGWLLFMLQFLVMGPIMIVAYKYRYKAPMWLTVGVYLFVFYNNSLNIMKESISCAFLLLAFFYFQESKYIKTAALSVGAILFHASSIIGIVTIFVVLQLGKIKAFWMKLFIILGLLLLLVNMQSISNSLINLNILPAKYQSNIDFVFSEGDSYLRMSHYTIETLFDLAFRCVFVIAPIALLSKKGKEQDEVVNLLVIIGLIFYVYTYFMYSTVYGGRVTLYFDFFLILLIPRLHDVVKIKASNGRDITGGAMITMLFTYWFPWIMISGWSASNHFVFRFLS